jgi:hypothetical protein
MKNETIGYIYSNRTVTSCKCEGYAILKYCPKVPSMDNISTYNPITGKWQWKEKHEKA